MKILPPMSGSAKFVLKPSSKNSIIEVQCPMSIDLVCTKCVKYVPNSIFIKVVITKQMHHLCFHHQFSCSKNLIFLHMCRYVQKFLRAVVDRWYTIPNTDRSIDWIHFRYFENAAVSGPFIFVPFLSIACAKKCCNNSI